MINTSLEKIAAVVDQLVLEITLPLRTAKALDKTALRKLTECLDELETVLTTEMMVPKSLAGNLWFIFIAMLEEAQYAKQNRQEIEIEAWKIAERLRQIFGPKW